MPEITDGCRKAAEEILDRCFKVERIGPGGPWEEEIQIAECIIARHTRAARLEEALRKLVSRAYAPGSIVVSAMIRAGQGGLVEPLTAEARALLAEMDGGEGDKEAGKERPMPKPESPERRTATEAIMQGAKMEQLDALVKFMLVHKLTLPSLLDRVKNPPERTALRELVEAAKPLEWSQDRWSGMGGLMDNVCPECGHSEGAHYDQYGAGGVCKFGPALARAEAVLNQPEAVRKGDGK